MSISITKRNYLLQSAILTLLVGGVGGGIYFNCFPYQYFGGYPLIPVFFFSFGIFAISMTEMVRRHSPKRLLQIYMLIRVMRMLFSIMLMVVYCLAVHEGRRAFLLTFIVNYLIYLIYDSWFFYCFELNKKLKKEKNETIA